jgi:hypothetical protein
MRSRRCDRAEEGAVFDGSLIGPFNGSALRPLRGSRGQGSEQLGVARVSYEERSVTLFRHWSETRGFDA